MDFRARVGGFELVSVEKSAPLRIVFLLKERNTGMQALAKLQVSDSDPPASDEFGYVRHFSRNVRHRL